MFESFLLYQVNYLWGLARKHFLFYSTQYSINIIVHLCQSSWNTTYFYFWYLFTVLKKVKSNKLLDYLVVKIELRTMCKIFTLKKILLLHFHLTNCLYSELFWRRHDSWWMEVQLNMCMNCILYWLVISKTCF